MTYLPHDILKILKRETSIQLCLALFKFHCVTHSLSPTLHVKSIGIKRATLSLVSLKFLIKCTVTISLIFDLFSLKLANLMVGQHIITVYIFGVLPTNILYVT